MARGSRQRWLQQSNEFLFKVVTRRSPIVAIIDGTWKPPAINEAH
jgi:hypothetical protein